jgi:hypothetical protein
MSQIQSVLNQFMPCGGNVCPGCVTGCYLGDGNVPDVDRMADAIIELRAERDELRKDAQLYRAFFDGLESVFGVYGDTIELCYVSTDAAELAVDKISAAMEVQP